MTHKVLAGSFTDDRGIIQDLIEGPVDAVTWIQTKRGAIRGNHYHRETRQWTYVVSGTLRVLNATGERIMGPGEIAEHPPGDPHAWKAITDSTCLVFTNGPRAGENYAEDTFRLKEPLLA